MEIKASSETIEGIENAIREVCDAHKIDRTTVEVAIGLGGVWTARRLPQGGKPRRSYTFNAESETVRDALRKVCDASL